jgi:hypothetical protein
MKEILIFFKGEISNGSAFYDGPSAGRVEGILIWRRGCALLRVQLKKKSRALHPSRAAEEGIRQP